MNSLTPFIRHELDEQPGASSAPENSCSRCSPPLGKEPEPVQMPGDPAAPGTQVPPQVEQPGRTPHPGPDSAPHGVPMTDGTPVACRQKNAAAFLAGEVPGVMAQYGGQLFGTEQNLDTAHPAPEEPDPAQSGVLDLVDWREDAPYG